MRRRVKLLELASLIVLAGIVGGVISDGRDAVALSYKSDVGIGFTFNPSLSVSLSSSDLVIPSLTPGGAAADSNVITVNVATNTAYGYTLTSTVGSSTGNASRNLVNSTDGTKTFSSIDFGSSLNEIADANTWGYSYSSNSGSTWANYSGLPLYSDQVNVATLIDTSDAADSDAVQFKIAAKAGSTQASGTYNNVINFMAVSKVAPMTLLDAFVASNVTQVNGYYTMQGMTSDICSAAEVGSSMQLLDTRDNKLYWVAKLGDENHSDCWMTQNLDLDITAGSTALTSQNTDLSSDQSVYTANNTIYALKGSGDTYGYTYENGIATWIPERSTIAYDQLNGTTWPNSNVYPYSYDRLDTTAGANNGQPVKPDSNVTDSHGLSGNYYNWTASIASNDSNNASSANPDQTNSICPKGWRLPSVTNKEFGNLLVQYGIISTNTSTSYIENQSSVNSMGAAPLYLVRGGSVSNGSLDNSGGHGGYWSSTFNNTSTAYYLSFHSSRVGPQNRNSRGNGHSIRCVARSQ